MDSIPGNMLMQATILCSTRASPIDRATLLDGMVDKTTRVSESVKKSPLCQPHKWCSTGLPDTRSTRIVLLIVHKYGGTSVGSVERIRAVAQRCVRTVQDGAKLAVVVSAMSGETARLLTLLQETGDSSVDRTHREVDVVLSAGEQVSAGLLASAIQSLGGKARSFLGAQAGIQTSKEYTRARIEAIDPQALMRCLDSGTIAVVAGFQGADKDGNITTLGRGGSDITAVAIAAALHADICEIYTDVEGVYTTDPNLVPTARKIEKITYEEMLELASVGAKVLQIRAVEFGMKYNVPIHVRSSFSDRPGTMVTGEDDSMEHLVVSGVSLVRDEAKITIRDVPDSPGMAARIFSPLSEAGIIVDMIVQNVSQNGQTDLTFTVSVADRDRVLTLLEKNASEACADGRCVASGSVAKISVVGVGMRSHYGVAQTMFQLLADEGINIQLISTSEIKISCIIDAKYAELALRTLHQGFGLDTAARSTKTKAS